jgi:hypothetical protein
MRHTACGRERLCEQLLVLTECRNISLPLRKWLARIFVYLGDEKLKGARWRMKTVSSLTSEAPG